VKSRLQENALLAAREAVNKNPFRKVSNTGKKPNYHLTTRTNTLLDIKIS